MLCVSCFYRGGQGEFNKENRSVGATVPEIEGFIERTAGEGLHVACAHHGVHQPAVPQYVCRADAARATCFTHTPRGRLHMLYAFFLTIKNGG